MLEVLEPGFLTTVQDGGRPEWTDLGVPVGGACDRWSLAVANRLVGNDAAAAALELTILGPTLRAREDVVIGLAGADLGGVERGAGVAIAHGRMHRLAAGAVLAFPGSGSGTAGARAYLALPGGVDVPAVLGSASTALAAGFGGFEGRSLRAGDVVRAAGRNASEGAGVSWPATGDDPAAGGTDPAIRVVRGPAAGDGRFEALLAGSWRVAAGSDRVGLRLEGPRIAPGDGGGLVLSHGVTFGAVQVPPDGAPIVLLADAQTTGGYPVPAVVISADRPRLGQLRPGATVAFAEVTLPEARDASIRQAAALARGSAAIRDAAAWDELWQTAGG